MAKSMRSKREKRLRAIRREIVEPFYDKKDAAKLAAQEAALAAPKLQLSLPSNTAMEASISTDNNTMDVEMANENPSKASLKPVGRIGKKLKKKFKLAKGKRRSGNSKPSRKRHI